MPREISAVKRTHAYIQDDDRVVPPKLDSDFLREIRSNVSFQKH